ncbi:GspE/PulE family protein [Pseudomonas auratipiscis]|uniref:ATPase, T2SS/T4P/T4SS family n=1 Tax=Pseudomonas auratipiscis TaxID=3115853 RepID=A0AB35WQB8_9PSED|nr:MULTISPECIES: ATPase, T2SS/T4P/T4SS family [unclassified Pseudomonas]MEE1865604.1 ATPase, T2SS/T4P/T4SS family [Pseudomonas sp. 120P]MEE1956410.1 ATPase, T2SS/T4P/T4SS family [Pseudomonas sp. 119P]
MTVSDQDRRLSLGGLLTALLDARLISPQAAHTLRSLRQTGDAHPLELIAAQNLPDPRQVGQYLDLESLCQWLAKRAGLPYLHIDPLQLDLGATTGLMSAAFARRHRILAIAADDNSVTVASAEPFVRKWEADLAQVLRRPIKHVLASPVQINRFSQAFFHMAHSVKGASHQAGTAIPRANLEQLLDLSANGRAHEDDDAHIVTIADWLLQYAFDQRASDIHLEPRRDQGHLRFRIDGLLHSVYQFPGAVTLAVISRLKTLAGMNVAEKRRPQDGRIKTRLPTGNELELRLSTLPTTFGEKLVLRIFDPMVLQQDFAQLGLEGDDLARWLALIGQRHGLILITGPTGSGKTSTLYTTLKHLATPQVNLCTVEDPIEMVEPRFNQLQVHPAIDLGFAEGTRALLRQDPDIIMIGEIRDLETAQVAFQAALTGHLVLSTLHTNDACSAITRLLELGLAAHLIKAGLIGVMAQRLVRTLCTCKQKAVPGEAGYLARGCNECRQTGYFGRTGIYELLNMNEGLKTYVHGDIDLTKLRSQAIADGMLTLQQRGAQKVASGVTTMTEVLRVASGN